LLPLIGLLTPLVAKLPFATWKQGHNVHVLETHDGRQFVLRPWSQRQIGYIGIQLFLRVSRSHEVYLTCLTADAPIKDVSEFIALLAQVAGGPPQHEPVPSDPTT
jgi:hypothetical protein